MMADPKDKTETPDSPDMAKIAENETAANTSTPQVEPPDEHSPDPIMTRE